MSNEVQRWKSSTLISFQKLLTFSKLVVPLLINFDQHIYAICGWTEVAGGVISGSSQHVKTVPHYIRVNFEVLSSSIF